MSGKPTISTEHNWQDVERLMRAAREERSAYIAGKLRQAMRYLSELRHHGEHQGSHSPA